MFGGRCGRVEGEGREWRGEMRRAVILMIVTESGVSRLVGKLQGSMLFEE